MQASRIKSLSFAIVLSLGLLLPTAGTSFAKELPAAGVGKTATKVAQDDGRGCYYAGEYYSEGAEHNGQVCVNGKWITT